jgi:glycosyltransferase involved in cell wall biosynthesis
MRVERVLLIGDFKDESAQAIRIERRHWLKGFIRLGLDVQRFSYRNIMEQLAPLKRKWFARMSKQRADNALVDHAVHYRPDLILILSMKHLDPETIGRLRQAAPGATVVGRDVDPWPEARPGRTAIAKCTDLVVASNAGQWLDYYRQQGVPRCAFIPCPCDPDIQRPYGQDERYGTDIFFSGKAGHESGPCDPDREELLTRLKAKPNARIYGAFGTDRIEGLDCFVAMSNAKICLSINAVNNVRMYHSDRFINSISCGAFTLAKRVPDTDLLFEDGLHVRYFDDCRHFFELLNYYLEHDAERRAIAAAGMARAHSEFNCTTMARHVLDLVEKGSYGPSWGCLLE